MALQISGTTVVNNSRELQNIASLDSTTTSTIAAAAGGGTKMITEQKTLNTSGTFTAPYTGDYRFFLFGGGGGGWSSNTGGSLTMRGGGGGAMVVFDTSLTANTSFSFTIGAGGDTPSGTDKNGVAGSASSCTINGTTLTAGGGGAGVIGTSAQAGGTASGGSLNFNGATATDANGGKAGGYKSDLNVPKTFQEGNDTGTGNGGSQISNGGVTIYLDLGGYGAGGLSHTSLSGHPTIVDGLSGAFHYICYAEL